MLSPMHLPLKPTVGSARADFPFGSPQTLFASSQRLLSLPSTTRLFSGHHYPSATESNVCSATVQEQKEMNRHLREGMGEEEFVKMRQERDGGLAEPKLLHQSLQASHDRICSVWLWGVDASERKANHLSFETTIDRSTFEVGEFLRTKMESLSCEYRSRFRKECEHNLQRRTSGFRREERTNGEALTARKDRSTAPVIPGTSNLAAQDEPPRCRARLPSRSRLSQRSKS
jgi:hypothetical protein